MKRSYILFALLCSLAAGPLQADVCNQNMRISSAKTVLNEVEIAAVQFPIRGGKSRKEFMALVENYITRAVKQKAKLIVFPELLILDMIKSTELAAQAVELKTMAQEFTPVFFDRIKELSAQHGVSILAGSTPRLVEGEVVNTALMAFPDGRTIMQDKIFLTPDEKAWGWKTGKSLNVFDTPWGRTSILICYDSQSPILSSMLSKYMPEMILVPSMTGKDGFTRVRWASQSRAVEHHAYVVVTGTVEARGSKALDYSGQAAFITPQDEPFKGKTVQGRKNTPASVVTKMDMKTLRESKKKAGLYSGKDQILRQEVINVDLE